MPRRIGVSTTTSTLILIAVAASMGGTAFAAMSGLAQAGTQNNANLQVNSAALVQGTNVAVVKIQLANLGALPISSLTFQLSGLESSSSSFSGTVSVVDTITGGSLYSGTFTPSTPVLSFSIPLTINPNENVNLVVGVYPGTRGAALFKTNNTYNLLITAQPYSQIARLLTARSP